MVCFVEQEGMRAYEDALLEEQLRQQELEAEIERSNREAQGNGPPFICYFFFFCGTQTCQTMQEHGHTFSCRTGGHNQFFFLTKTRVLGIAPEQQVEGQQQAQEKEQMRCKRRNSNRSKTRRCSSKNKTKRCRQNNNNNNNNYNYNNNGSQSWRLNRHQSKQEE